MKAKNKNDYQSPVAEVVDLLCEGTILTGSQVVGGGSGQGVNIAIIIGRQWKGNIYCCRYCV